MELSSSWEAVSCATTQEFPNILWNRKSLNVSQPYAPPWPVTGIALYFATVSNVHPILCRVVDWKTTDVPEEYVASLRQRISEGVANVDESQL
jgi:hypothetical protein